MDKKNVLLNKTATVAAKTAEVFYWVSVVLLFAGLIAYRIDSSLLKLFMDVGDGEFGISGYSIHILGANGQISAAAFIGAVIIGILVNSLMAMIFRNIYLIFKTSKGLTKFSKGATPFQSANIRMLREIGIFAVSIPVIEYIGDAIINVITGPSLIESSVSFTGITFGLAFLCMSQFFAYGAELQKESDGLI